MNRLTFAAIALFILTFSWISGRIQKSIITPPMIFVLFGLLVSDRGLGLIEMDAENPLIHTLAELPEPAPVSQMPVRTTFMP